MFWIVKLKKNYQTQQKKKKSTNMWKVIQSHIVRNTERSHHVTTFYLSQNKKKILKLANDERFNLQREFLF